MDGRAAKSLREDDSKEGEIMFIVQINSVDASAHTLEVDAQRQKAMLESQGETNVAIVEKDFPDYPQPGH